MKQIPVGRGLFTLVDDADYEWLSRWKWRAQFDKHTGTYYVHRNLARLDGKRPDVKMARLILELGFGDDRMGEHINQNTLDNQRSNLRIATVAQNNRNRRKPKNNTSGHKGIHKVGKTNRWQVSISRDKVRYFFGSYSTLEEAVAVRDERITELHGEFMRLA